MNGNKWFLVIIIGAALLLGSASLALAQDDNAAIFERYINQIWHFGQVDTVVFLVTPDHLHHDVTLAAPISGVDALKAYVRKCRTDLPDLDFTVGRIDVEGDKVFANLTATLLDAQVPVTASVRVADGKLVETWFDVNALVTNPDIEAAVAEVEAANLAVEGQFIEFNQNLGAYTTDQRTFSAKYNSFYSAAGYSEHGFLMNGSTTIANAASDYGWYRAISIAFPDLEWTAESVVAHGALVYTHYTSIGTFENPWELPGWGGWVSLQPTGKKVTESGVIIHRIEDGRIVEMWWYVDSPAFWSEVALLLERGYGWGYDAHQIYNLNQPK